MERVAAARPLCIKIPAVESNNAAEEEVWGRCELSSPSNSSSREASHDNDR